MKKLYLLSLLVFSSLAMFSQDSFKGKFIKADMWDGITNLHFEDISNGEVKILDYNWSSVNENEENEEQKKINREIQIYKPDDSKSMDECYMANPDYIGEIFVVSIELMPGEPERGIEAYETITSLKIIK